MTDSDPQPTADAPPPGMIAGACVYTGPSMNPTLMESDLLEIDPSPGTVPAVGDIILFTIPETGEPVIHRVIAVAADGIRTRGDNSSRVDTWLLQPNDILGRVVAARRGLVRRELAGGPAGSEYARRLRRWRRTREAIAVVVRPLYWFLAQTGICRLFLPAPWRPQVLSFRTGELTQLRLLMKGREIGWYNARRGEWEIWFPYLLFVDRRRLPKP